MLQPCCPLPITADSAASGGLQARAVLVDMEEGVVNEVRKVLMTVITKTISAAAAFLHADHWQTHNWL